MTRAQARARTRIRGQNRRKKSNEDSFRRDEINPFAAMANGGFERTSSVDKTINKAGDTTTTTSNVNDGETFDFSAAIRADGGGSNNDARSIPTASPRNQNLEAAALALADPSDEADGLSSNMMSSGRNYRLGLSQSRIPSYESVSSLSSEEYGMDRDLDDSRAGDPSDSGDFSHEPKEGVPLTWNCSRGRHTHSNPSKPRRFAHRRHQGGGNSRARLRTMVQPQQAVPSAGLAAMKLHETQEQGKQSFRKASLIHTPVDPPSKGQHRWKMPKDSALSTPQSELEAQVGKSAFHKLTPEIPDALLSSRISRRKPKADKYSQAYFEERIKELRTLIISNIPTQDELVPPENSVHLPVLQSLEAAKQTLESSKAVAKALQNEQKSHPEDEGWKDSSLVDPVKRGMEEAQAAIDRLEQAATNSGCAIVKNSGLLDEKARNAFRGRATKCTTAKNKSLLQVKQELLECTVLTQATPKKLAEWCAEDPDVNRLLLDRFLGPSQEATELLMKFLEAGGPSNGNYGMAFSIYSKLQQELLNFEKLESSISQRKFFLRRRLVLAVALEHATPIPIFKQEDTFVDPVERFHYYVKFALTDGDRLDPAFFTLSTWELRKVVDANATHDDLTWGRQFLRNYRPDQVYMKDQKWKYVMSVRTDVGYRHPDHEFTNYQELLSAGGECGPRAFFGRFISKAWGLPTWGVRQPGHAAMTRWTSDKNLGGWTVCLGAGWEYSWWDDDRYGGKSRRGPDFYEETKARSAAGCPHTYFKTVVLLECLAESLGETIEEDFVVAKFWRFLALAQRKMLARSFGSTNRVENCDNYNRNVHSSASGWPICKEYGCICHHNPEHDSKHESRRRNMINPVGSSTKPTEIISQYNANRLKREIRPNGTITILEPKKLSNRMLKRVIPKKQETNQVWIAPDGTIVIPAAKFVEPKKPNKKVLVMKSFLGGDQLHLVHDGEVEYDMPSSVTTSGTYSLSAKVVNVHRDQKPLLINIEKSFDSEDDNTNEDYVDVDVDVTDNQKNKNDDDDSDSFLHIEEYGIDGYEIIHLPPQGQQELEVQYTKGYWEQTKSILVYLSPGGKLKLSRKDPCFGLSIKEIYLKPV